MFNQDQLPKVYTPEQVAEMLQLSKNSVYELINRGEIVAKKIGKQYRVPQASLQFFFSGLDQDLWQAEQVDRQNLEIINQALDDERKTT